MHLVLFATPHRLETRASSKLPGALGAGYKIWIWNSCDFSRTQIGPLSTLSGHSLALLDDLVGAGEDRWRHGETERVRGLQIDD
jgi:hypothetical protein